eukprot:TRINITY_DN6987_c0_g1_i1.p1 TRINITY_DN6987_c0_g1~~TRINITY_DN6987_c0_g1_i1.p1  ORF type:complete len:158 (+),score=19.79 TRINITY_DN6987_c0_g1_i1:121-594(+)
MNAPAAPDVKQNFEEAVAMCKAASAAAAEEHTVKRRRHLQGAVLALILMFFVIIGIRRTMRQKKFAPARPIVHADQPTEQNDGRKAEVMEKNEKDIEPKPIIEKKVSIENEAKSLPSEVNEHPQPLSARQLPPPPPPSPRPDPTDNNEASNPRPQPQ